MRSRNLFLSKLLANTIADYSNTVFNADRPVIFQNLLFRTKPTSCTICIFWGKSVMNLSRSLRVRVIKFSSLLPLNLLQVRCFHERTVSRWRISDKITFFSLIISPTINWVILNHFCKWILLQDWLARNVLVRIEGLYNVIRRSGYYWRFKVLNSTF